MSPTQAPRTALITGASRGIGAVYAHRLAMRGHDLIMVARDRERLDALAQTLRAETGRRVDVVVADLTVEADLARVLALFATHDDIDLVVNNAGVGSPGLLASSDTTRLDGLLQLNVVALTRIAQAAVSAFVARKRGVLVNIASAFALHLAPGVAAYAGSKAYVLHFSRALQLEVGKHGVTVQAVLPGAISTDIWASSGVDLATLPPEIVMSPEDLVDAALAGLEHGETITIPSLPDLADWDAYESARLALVPNLSRNRSADRYRTE